MKKFCLIFLFISFNVLGACDQSQTEAIKYNHRYLNKDLKITFLDAKDDCRYALISEAIYSEYILTASSNNVGSRSTNPQLALTRCPPFAPGALMIKGTRIEF